MVVTTEKPLLVEPFRRRAVALLMIYLFIWNYIEFMAVDKTGMALSNNIQMFLKLGE